MFSEYGRWAQVFLSCHNSPDCALALMIEQCPCWCVWDDATSYFERSWKPQCWKQAYRFLFVRSQAKQQQKGPIQ